MTRIFATLALVLAFGCAGEGTTIIPADPVDTDTHPVESDTDPQETDTDPVLDTDAPTDTGTEQADPVVVTIERDGLALRITVTGPLDGATWTVTTLGTTVDLVADGTALVPFDPCLDLGTTFDVTVTTATDAVVTTYTLDGSIVNVPGPYGNYRELDLSSNVLPVALCDGWLGTGKEQDFYGWDLTMPAVDDWQVTAIAHGDATVVLSESMFVATDFVSVAVTPGSPTPIDFTLVIDGGDI